jgi:hypothetical protein
MWSWEDRKDIDMRRHIFQIVEVATVRRVTAKRAAEKRAAVGRAIGGRIAA